MVTMLEHWKANSQLMRGRTDDYILEDMVMKLPHLTPREREHLSNEMALIWLGEWSEARKKEGE